MAADSNQALNYIETPGWSLGAISLSSLPVIGLPLSFIETPTFSSGGGGAPTRPSSGFLYPRGDY